jgi:hypothetical protein
MATARSKVRPNAFSDNFVLFWLLPVQCDSRCKEGCNYLWHGDCSVALMWLGNADELLQICLWHAIFCYLFGITLLCMLICGDAAGLAPGCGLLHVVGSPGPRLQLPPRPHTETLVVVTFSLSYTLSLVSSSGSLFSLLSSFWYHGHRRGDSVLYLHVGFG